MRRTARRTSNASRRARDRPRSATTQPRPTTTDPSMKKLRRVRADGPSNRWPLGRVHPCLRSHHASTLAVATGPRWLPDLRRAEEAAPSRVKLGTRMTRSYKGRVRRSDTRTHQQRGDRDESTAPTLRHDRVSFPHVRPVVRAPERKEVMRRNRATSSRQPAGASPARGDARVPGREAPVPGREVGCEAGWNNRPVRSMKRSLQRRHIYPRGSGAKGEPSPCGVGEGHGRHQGTWSGCPRTPRRMGRGTVGRVSWELERPSSARVCGPGSMPTYNQRTGSGGRPRGSRRGP